VLADVLRRETAPVTIPAWVARLIIGDDAVLGATQSRGASNARARRELGWTPRYPSWRQGFAASFGPARALKSRGLTSTVQAVVSDNENHPALTMGGPGSDQ